MSAGVPPRLRLHHYWRSSCSWRVRWAFLHKGLPLPELNHIDLLKGEQKAAENLARNPLGSVPTLEFLGENNPDRRFLTQSLAIIDWLEENHPTSPLYPTDSYLKGRVRALALTIVADTQPIQNLNVMRRHSSDEVEQGKWAQQWNEAGLAAFEKLCAPIAGKHAVGDHVTMADLALIPQCYNALRRGLKLEAFPCVFRAYQNALATTPCSRSAPEKFQPSS
ncbi:MAG: maleylacetoacetate isomerase [Bacteriovoracia bacterium]